LRSQTEWQDCAGGVFPISAPEAATGRRIARCSTGYESELSSVRDAIERLAGGRSYNVMLIASSQQLEWYISRLTSRFVLEPWSGKLTVPPLYTIANGHLSIPIKLQPYQSSLLTFIPLSTTPIRHAVDSTAPRLSRDSTGLKLFAQSTAAGTYSTTLDNGTIKSTTIGTVPATISLKSWSLAFDDWQPADGNGTTGDLTATKLVRHNLSLTSLTDWTTISDNHRCFG